MDERDRPSAEGPLDAVVHRVHDRYLIEVVEALNLCPFARRCRETQRLARPLLRARGDFPTPADGAEVLFRIAEAQPDVEVVMLTFLLPEGHPLLQLPNYDRFQRELRKRVEGGPVRFYLAGFHPLCSAQTGRPITPHNLPPLLRRTPDPVIQCVRADLLDRVRQDDHRFHKLIEREPDPEVRAMLAFSASSNSSLSDDVAEANFERVGGGKGREELERRLADIHEDRKRSYSIKE